jgi:quercetin dioxygenase-like cupin family protein
MKRRLMISALIVFALTPAFLLMAQVGGAHWWAIPVPDDPGISWMVFTDTPEIRVLRDFAEPGATRRMHHHSDATWHVLTLATGKIRLTIEGDAPFEISAGQSLSLKGGVNHTFTNVGSVTATLVEVFGKAKS